MEEHPAAVQLNSELPVPAGTSSSAPELCQKSDHQLRNIFGITADVRICLQKIDEMPRWCVSASVVQTNSRGPVDGSDLSRDVLKAKEVSLQDFPSPDKLDVDGEHSPSPHSRTLRSPCVSKENCCSFSPEAKPLFSYVEPIDEDFPTKTTSPRYRTRLSILRRRRVWKSTRTLGEWGGQGSAPCVCAVSPYSASRYQIRHQVGRVGDVDVGVGAASKRAGRTKAARKSHPNCRVHKPPAGSDPSTVPEGLKGHEQIRRHNEHQAKKQHK